MSDGKRPFEYSGRNSQGVEISGIVNAASEADALKLASAMGCLNPVIGTKPTMLVDNKGISAASILPIKQTTSRLVGEPQSVREIAPQAVPRIEDNARLAAMVDGIKDNVERQVESISMRRRQSLIIGSEAVVKTSVEPLLSNAAGKILSVEMRPDHHGNMVFAIVIEHEEARISRRNEK